MVPSVHSLQEGPRGHTDYKTTRLQTQPANRKHNKENTEKPTEAAYRGKDNKVRVFMLRVQIKVAMAWVSHLPVSWIKKIHTLLHRTIT